ncbi:O-methyltransferase [Legionella beliardensis]|uniref:O-methyltransferase n=1 Tax=Legionella beliardensis TaxID=91822 RepID=A0A378I0J6_9GAMM|nr:methyltransferase [Legionella beliardensis]STX28717.1 O-methyltransferase [Legionella beliardensis]
MSYEQEPFMILATMSRWYVVSRAIHVVAQLGLANYMSDEPISIEQLAEQSNTKPELLARLMRFLSAYKLFNFQQNGYSLTELSKPLRDDDPHSIRDVLCMADESWWQAFSQFDESLKTGKSAFYHQHGDHFFNYLSKNPQKQANFDRGMAKLSTYDDDTISKSYNFGELTSIVDMGGGRGGMVQSIAKHYPTVNVILFDTPAVINQLNAHEFPPQARLIAGDFLKEIPMADAYLFKGVLHDFDDATMQQILTNCAQQMPKKSTLFIAEQVMPDDNTPHPNKTMDIVMMVLLGGRQRTLSEWQQSIEPLGFHFEASYNTTSLFTLMKFSPS